MFLSKSEWNYSKSNHTDSMDFALTNLRKIEFFLSW